MIFLNLLTLPFLWSYSVENQESKLLDDVRRFWHSCLLEERFGLGGDHLPCLFFISVGFLQDEECEESKVDDGPVSTLL